METAPQLHTSRPSNRRLIALGMTALGALLMGIGSMLAWVTVGLRDLAALETTSPGTDFGAGLITLVSAVVILVLILMSGFIAGPARRGMAIVIVVAAALSTALASWFILSASDHYSPVDDERLVGALASAMGRSAEEVRSALTTVIEQLGGYTHIGPGPWVVMLGGVIALAGGVVTYRWASWLASTPTPLPPH